MKKTHKVSISKKVLQCSKLFSEIVKEIEGTKIVSENFVHDLRQSLNVPFALLSSLILTKELNKENSKKFLISIQSNLFPNVSNEHIEMSSQMVSDYCESKKISK